MAKVTNEQLLKEVRRGFGETKKYTNQKISDLSKSTDRKIDDLAIMVQGGFSEVGKRLDKHDKNFEEIKEWQHLADGKFDVLEHELLNIKKDLENVIYRHEFENIKERVKDLEIQLAAALKKK